MFVTSVTIVRRTDNTWSVLSHSLCPQAVNGVEFVRVQEASRWWSVYLYILEARADSRFYRVLPKLGQVCEFPRAGKPVGGGLCIFISWRRELTAGFIGVC